jgi:hypothetical protein
MRAASTDPNFFAKKFGKILQEFWPKPAAALTNARSARARAGGMRATSTAVKTWSVSRSGSITA